MSSLFAALHVALNQDRQRICLRTYHGDVTRGELLTAAARVADLLRELGVKPGDRVVAQVEKSLSALQLYLGCLHAGAVYVPLNTGYTLAEVSYFVADAEPKLLVCETATHAEFNQRFSPLAVVALQGEQGIIALAADRQPLPMSAHVATDLAAILYTSGTTGRSKGAMLTQENLLSNAQTLVALWGITDRDVLIHALPIYHVHGLFVALHTAWLAGATIRFLDKFDARRVIGELEKSTLMMGVPTHYTRLLEEPTLNRQSCANMRLFISGSAPLLPQTFGDFEARTGMRILERYGMTEAGMITSNPLNGSRLRGTVGLALPGVRLRLRTEQGLVERGGPGVLEIAGPNVFSGYWRNPEKTKEEFTADGYFVTGDIAEISAEGVVSLVGRAKDLIISGGLNVYPKEIEEAIDALPGVRESAVIGVPHRDFGEAVMAVVCPESSQQLDEAAIATRLRSQLAAFKVPKRIVVVADLPRNAMGKVQKNLLRNEYAGTFKS